MDHLWIALVVQLSLTFGIAGLFWPEKFLPLFELLLHPFWAASLRVIRAHSVAALVLSAVLLASLLGNIR